MQRIQLHLTDGQARRLRALARARHTTRAALIRAGIEAVLRQGSGAEGDSLLVLIGQAGAGGVPTNASEAHDRLIGAAKLGRHR
jgi:hypothetical protein